MQHNKGQTMCLHEERSESIKMEIRKRGKERFTRYYEFFFHLHFNFIFVILCIYKKEE